jgi:putative restriction endonuclease
VRLRSIACTRLEKAALDNGFDLDLGATGQWLRYGSSHAPLKVWLSALGEGFFLVAFSMGNVASALSGLGTKLTHPMPAGAVGARSVAEIPALHRLLRRAFQLSRTLPDELLHTFQQKTAGLPDTTEAERLVGQRVGQDIYRKGLLDYWEGRCAVTGLAVPALLRASHIKPWADCATDTERMDVFNGFLLAPHMDAAFDRGFVTVADDGAVVVSEWLDGDARPLLGLVDGLKVAGLTDGHRGYLPWHRHHVFQSASTGG